jgi:UDP-glucose 4-epimerase
MKAVVTGGAGLIGSTLVDQLLMDGHEVVALDDLKDDHSKSVHFLQPQLGKVDFRLEAVDLLDPNRLRGFLVDADVIFHLTGHTISERPADGVAQDNLANTTGTLNVLLAAKNAGVKRVISSSSSAVYRKATNLPVKETDPTTTTSSGAKIALANEEYCQLFNDIYGLQTVHSVSSQYLDQGRDQVRKSA